MTGPAAEQSFSARNVDVQHPNFWVTGQVRTFEHEYSPGDRQDKHAHPYASISIVLAGSVSETVGSKIEEALPLSVVVKPAGTEHLDRFGTFGARLFSVQIEPELIASLNDWQLRINHWHWVHQGATARWLLRLMQACRRPTHAGSDDVIYEVLASLSAARPGRAGNLPKWLGHVKQELEETFRDGVQVRDLAARAEVHPVYLARQFRHYMGCSVTDYRTFLKVRAAAQVLSGSAVPLATAAHDCGFTDQSHMGRAFKAASGLTPRHYRKLTTTSQRQAA